MYIFGRCKFLSTKILFIRFFRLNSLYDFYKIIIRNHSVYSDHRIFCHVSRRTLAFNNFGYLIKRKTSFLCDSAGWITVISQRISQSLNPSPVIIFLGFLIADITLKYSRGISTFHSKFVKCHIAPALQDYISQERIVFLHYF